MATIPSRFKRILKAYLENSSLGGSVDAVFNTMGVAGDITDTGNSTTLYDQSTQTIGSGNETADTAEIQNPNYVEPQIVAADDTSYTVGDTSYNADLTLSNYHKVTLGADVTFDFTNVAASDVNSVVLQLVQDSTGGRSPLFTPTVVWDGGTAPSWSTGANEEDFATFVHDQDGGQWVGLVGGLAIA